MIIIEEYEMRFEKKLISLGGTKAVILPKAWYTELGRKTGKVLTMVHLDVTDEEIRITPAWKEEK